MIYRRLFTPTLFRQKYTRPFTTSHNDVNHSQENVDISNEINNDQPHEFIETTKAQRLILSIGSSMAALVNPRR